MKHGAWSRLVLALLAALVWMAPGPSLAGEALTEEQKIERLISGIERLDQAKFVRNGRSYDAKTAARFLRGKWSNRKDEVESAAEFIDEVASKSSTSGKAYLILHEGREIPAARYFKQELSKLENIAR